MAEPASGAAAVECAENENKSLDVPPRTFNFEILRPSRGLESVTGYNSCSRDMKRSRGIQGSSRHGRPRNISPNFQMEGMRAFLLNSTPVIETLSFLKVT